MRRDSRIIRILAVLTVTVGLFAVLVQCSPADNGGGIQVILPTPTLQPIVELKVYISGAVTSPGVYSVHEGDRLADVVELSGGASEDADLAAVNLAVRVEDEDHWHIPRLGEEPQSTVSTNQNRTGTPGKVDVNSASVEQLKTLPGIGDVKAQSIVVFRESNGPFTSVDELTEVRGIGTATLESIRDLVEAQ